MHYFEGCCHVVIQSHIILLAKPASQAIAVTRNMREAITLHLRGMIEDQEPIPVPQTMAEYTDISLPNSAA